MAPKPTTDLLSQLRALMKNTAHVPEPLNAYIVPSSDAHNSEYLSECDDRRAFITGFTGSAGTAILTDDKALLWTDGRYYLQASEQIDSNWVLMKDGMPTTPTQEQWLSLNLPKNSSVGVDPKLFSHDKFTSFQEALDSHGHKLVPVSTNLVDKIWKDQPPRPKNPVTPLASEFSGKPIKDKLKEVNKEMKEKKAKYLVLTALDEVAWFLNLRGSDIKYNPVFFAYVIISSDDVTVFLDPKQNTEAVRDHLESETDNKFKTKPYDDIENSLKSLASNLDGYIWFSESASFALTNLIPKKNRQITKITPVELMKAIKNPVEAQGMRNAHTKDAIALCSYFAWLEKNVKDKKITEVSGAAKLLEFRSLQKDFEGASFGTISSVGPHGAIIHYQPDDSTDVQIRTDQLYLCDSGGQYKDGTTDVTRTLHFGTPTDYEKTCYTRVLKGQLKLGRAVFPNKIRGNFLDCIAREFLWQVGLDYGHGTGHGIGSFLNVHEGPMGIHWRHNPRDPGLEKGMFLSNEPGYYEDGEFGMRIEDIVEIVEANTPHNFNNRGFLTFDTITLVPKSIKLIKKSMLTEFEVQQLNSYHQQCRNVLVPILEKEGLTDVKDWLYKETEPI